MSVRAVNKAIKESNMLFKVYSEKDSRYGRVYKLYDVSSGKKIIVGASVRLSDIVHKLNIRVN